MLTATAKIEKTHSNVTSIAVYDSLGQVTEIPFEKKPHIVRKGLDVQDRLKEMTIPEIVAELEALPKDVAEKTQDTIRNIGRACHAMIAADAEIVRIMADKSSLKL